MDKSRKIAVSALVVLGGFAAAVFYHYARTVYFGHEFSTFLFKPQDRFMDFFNNYDGWRTSVCIWSKTYVYDYCFLCLTSFGNLVYYLFSLITPPGLSFFLFCAIPACFFWAACLKYLKTSDAVENIRNFIILGFMSYPVLFTLDRGNNEFFVFMFLLCSVFFLKDGKLLASALFLAFAAATKPFVLVFAVMFLGRGKRGYILAGAAAYIALQAASSALLSLAHGVNVWEAMGWLEFLLEKGGKYHLSYAVGDYGLAHGNSLFGLLKMVIYHFYNWIFYTHGSMANIVGLVMRPYALFAFASFAAVAAYVALVERVFWKQAALLICCMNLLPYVSGDYKLLHLFIPFFLFVNSEPAEDDFRYALLFGLLLIPKNYLVRIFAGVPPHVGIGSAANPLLMLAMCVFIIREGLKNSSVAEMRARLNTIL